MNLDLIQQFITAHESGNVKQARSLYKQMGLKLDGAQLIECKFNFFRKNPNEPGLKRILGSAVSGGYYELAIKIVTELKTTLSTKQKEKIIKIAVAKRNFPHGWILAEVETLSVSFKNSILEDLLRFCLVDSWDEETEIILNKLGRELTSEERFFKETMEEINAWLRSD